MANPQHPDAVEVFYSYSHADEGLRDQLQKHLALLKRQSIIKEWHDRSIAPGQEWGGHIDEHLNSADIILLLISADFLASAYCYDIEVKRAMERHEAKEAKVIPIILRPCDWSGSPFGKLQALPKDARPVTLWSNQDEAFLNVVKGIREAAEELLSSRAARQTRPDEEEKFKPRSEIPRPPIVGFVARRDREGRDILNLLKQELAPGRNKSVTLSGAGGFGKTTIAAEAFRELSAAYEGRLVWSDVNARAGYTLPTLLDDIATQLARPDLRALAPDPKAEAVRALLAERPALVALDNYETVDADERKRIERWLADAPCSALITSRQPVSNTLPVVIPAMPPDEAEKFLDARISVTLDPQLYTAGVRERIYKEAEANPFLMEWVVAQIDEAREPGRVLEELRRGEGDAAERVFGRSFMLPQAGDDGRDALLALSLFVPSASRPALAAVAGFGEDEKRLDAALKSLRALWLIRGVDENRRFTVEGLTRTLSSARLSKEGRADEFRKRFIAYFLRYAISHRQPTPEDYEALEAERDNLLSAVEAAFACEDWQSVIHMAYALARPANGMLGLHGYWDECLKVCDMALKAARSTGDDGDIVSLTHNAAVMYANRGEITEAQELYDESLEISKRLGNQRGISSTLHQLGGLANDRGDLDEARRLYGESLEISKQIGFQRGVAGTLHQLAGIAEEQGELDEAHRLYGESLEISKQIGFQTAVAATLNELGRLAQNQGDLSEARRLYGESLENSKRLSYRSGIAISLYALGTLENIEGNVSEAVRLVSEALNIFEKLGSPNADKVRRYLKKLKDKA